MMCINSIVVSLRTVSCNESVRVSVYILLPCALPQFYAALPPVTPACTCDTCKKNNIIAWDFICTDIYAEIEMVCLFQTMMDVHKSVSRTDAGSGIKNMITMSF